LADLGFEQVADYFAIRSKTDDGAQEVAWLFPLIDGQVVEHDEGPFDGLRLFFSPQEHPPRRARRFLEVVERMIATLEVQVRDRWREERIPHAAVAARVTADVETITKHWAARGIACGSSEALDLR
jgi:hypothetical protein